MCSARCVLCPRGDGVDDGNAPALSLSDALLPDAFAAPALSLSDALPPGLVRGAAQTSFSADGIPRKYLFLGCVALALHVHWFRAWVIGMRKRAKRKKSED